MNKIKTYFQCTEQWAKLPWAELGSKSCFTRFLEASLVPPPSQLMASRAQTHCEFRPLGSSSALSTTVRSVSPGATEAGKNPKCARQLLSYGHCMVCIRCHLHTQHCVEKAASKHAPVLKGLHPSGKPTACMSVSLSGAGSQITTVPQETKRTVRSDVSYKGKGCGK